MQRDEFVQKIYLKIGIVFAVIIVVMLVVFLGVIPFVKYLSRPAFIDILVTPVDATITMNDKEMRNAVYEMEPGEYNVFISRDGFEPVTIELNLEKNKTTGLYVYLEPMGGDWGFYEEAKNQQSLDVLLRLNGLNSDGEAWEPKLGLIQENDYAKEIADKYSVKSITPVYISICGEPENRMNCNAIHIEYKYSKSCDNELCLVVVGRTRELEAKALNKIKEEFSQKGYNFDDYKYVYVQDTEI